MRLSTNGSAASSSVRARGYLAHRLPPRVRADLAAQHYAQKRPIEAPTVNQLAVAYRVSAARVRRLLNGKPVTVEEAVASWRRWTPKQRAEFGRGAGVADVWDHAIAPVITDERTS